MNICNIDVNPNYTINSKCDQVCVLSLTLDYISEHESDDEAVCIVYC